MPTSEKERTALEEELKTLTTKKEGQTSADTKRVKEIKDALKPNSDGGESKGRSTGKRSKYPDNIKAAAKRVGEIRGQMESNPAPKQHVLVRKVVTKELGGEQKVSPDAIVKLSGAKSEKHLREIVQRKAPREDLKALRPLGQKMKDAYAVNRHLAGILLVWIEELKKA